MSSWKWAGIPWLQVWGIDREERRLYFRKGVTHEEPTGRSWVNIELTYSGQADSLSLYQTEGNSSLCAFSLNDTDSVTEDTVSQQSSPEDFKIQTQVNGGSGNNLVSSVTDANNAGGDRISQSSSTTITASNSQPKISKNSSFSSVSDETVDFVWDYKSSGEDDKKESNQKDPQNHHNNGEEKSSEATGEVSQGLQSVSCANSQSVSYKKDCHSGSSGSGTSMKLEFKPQTSAPISASPEISSCDPASCQPSDTNCSDIGADSEGTSLPPDSLELSLDSYPNESEEEEEEDFMVDLTESPTEEGLLQWQWVSATKCLIQNDSMIQQWFGGYKLQGQFWSHIFFCVKNAFLVSALDGG